MPILNWTEEDREFARINHIQLWELPMTAEQKQYIADERKATTAKAGILLCVLSLGFLVGLRIGASL